MLVTTRSVSFVTVEGIGAVMAAGTSLVRPLQSQHQFDQLFAAQPPQIAPAYLVRE